MRDDRAHILELDTGERFAFRRRAEMRAKAQCFLQQWRAEQPGVRAKGSWAKGRKSIGERYLLTFCLRGDAARRYWLAASRHEIYKDKELPWKRK